MGENTMREFDSILNASETYGDKLAEFLKRKTAPKPQSNTPFVLGGFDVSIDIDVDVVKLPPKPQSNEGDEQAASKQSLRELTGNEENTGTNNDPLHKTKNDAPAISPPPQGNAKTSSSTSATSPTSYPINIRQSVRRSVPGSDRLRRVAIQRRSRSCGRRDLMQEFNNATFDNSTFVPAVSSTPASIKPTQDEEKQIVAPQVTSKKLAQPQKAGSFMERSSRRPSITLSHESLSQRPNTPDSPTHRRTYTVEVGPEPGQLLLSPTSKNKSSNNSQRMSNLSPSNSLHSQQVVQPAQQLIIAAQKAAILAPDTPTRLKSQYIVESQPEFVVPETQPQELSNHSVLASYAVVPLTCLSPKSLQTSVRSSPRRLQVVESKSSPVSAARVQTADVAPSATVDTEPPPSSAPHLRSTTVANRSQQTSCSPRYVKNLNDILTEDESDDERHANSTAPLNLAPPGGNITRERRMRKTAQRQNSPEQLLDLHRSRTRNSIKRNKRQTVLNKPSKPAINGEQFAEELARMSNYEILDLRKRKSLGKLHAFNGNSKQQKIIDEHIELEIQRRNLDESDSSTVPKNTSTATTVTARGTESEHNDSMNRQLRSRDQRQLRPSRSRHRESPVSTSEDESESNRLPATPPVGFRDRSVRRQHTLNQQDISVHRQKQHTRTPSLMETFESDPPVSTLPMSPPVGFRESSFRETRSVYKQKNSKQDHQQERSGRQSRSLRRTLKDDYHRSPSPVPPPPNGFSDSLQRKVSQIPHEGTPPQGQEQRKQNQSQSRREKTMNNENVCSESPAPPPPLGFRNSVTPLKQVSSQHYVRSPSPPRTRHGMKQLSISKIRSSKPPIVSENITSASSAAASPPRDFRDSLQLPNSPIQEQNTIQQHRAQKKKKAIQSPIRMVQNENVCSTSPEASPPHGFGNSPQHEEDLHHHRSLRHTESPIAKLNNNTMSTTLSDTLRTKNKVKNNENNEQVTVSAPLREQENDETALAEDAPQLFADVPPPVEFNAVQIEERVQAFHMETSTLAVDAVNVTKTVELVQPTKSTESSKKHKQLDQTQTNETGVFKKPLKSAPKTKKKGTVKRELRNLTISQSISSLDTNESSDEANTTTVRKSKRGHVPLCNTFSTTMADPFAFMRKKHESFKSAAKEENKRLAPSNISNIVSNHPPLFSSTPLSSTHVNANNVHTKETTLQTPELNNLNTISGISPLGYLSEQLEEEAVQQSEPAPKKRSRKKKKRSDENSNDEEKQKQLNTIKELSDEIAQTTAPSPKKKGRKKKIPDEEPVESQQTPEEVIKNVGENQGNAVTEACNQEFQPPDSPLAQEQRGEQFPLIGWLRDSTFPVCSEEDPINVQTDSLAIARASNLQYSNLDGLDYAFYHVGDSVKLGYMRFKPLQVRGTKRAKTGILQFVALHGCFVIESTSSNQTEPLTEKFDLNAGDMVEINKGSRYNIINRLNEVGVLLINRIN